MIKLFFIYQVRNSSNFIRYTYSWKIEDTKISYWNYLTFNRTSASTTASKALPQCSRIPKVWNPFKAKITKTVYTCFKKDRSYELSSLIHKLKSDKSWQSFKLNWFQLPMAIEYMIVFGQGSEFCLNLYGHTVET